jgi:thermostable 8-oxoguanine DNA glycosylase
MLDKVLWQDLVGYKGIGPKTAAFFLLHSRPIFDIPVIDTHMVKYMASKGVEMKVTSNISKYLENAKIVKSHMERDFPNMTTAEADLHIWKLFSGREKPVDTQPSLI